MRYIFSFATLLVAIVSFSQNDNGLPERQAFKLKLPVDKKSTYEADIPASPYVRNDNIVQLYPGETVYLEAEESEGKLKLKSVKESKNPDKTISISFTQNIEKKRHVNMVLKVSNPFAKDLTYSAQIFIMKANKWTPTNVLPVIAKLSAFEMWPDVIVTIGLGDWKLNQ